MSERDTHPSLSDDSYQDGHEHLVWEAAACAAIDTRDILGASVGISTRTPYCSTVCLCLNNSLTHGKFTRDWKTTDSRT